MEPSEEKTVQKITPPHLQTNINCPSHQGLKQLVRLGDKSLRVPRKEWVLRKNAIIENAQQEPVQENSREDVLKAVLAQNEILKSQYQALQNEIILLKEKNSYLSDIEKRIVHLEKDVEIIYSVVEDVY